MAKASGFNWLRTELTSIARAVEQTKGFKLDAFELGGPGDELPDEGFEVPVPDSLRRLVATMDGCDLRWSTKRGRGRISVFALPEILAAGDQGTFELGTSLAVVPTRGEATPLLTLGEDGEELGVMVFDPDGYLVRESCSLEEMLHAYVDHLGIEGWALALRSEPNSEAHACAAAAVRFRTQLGLPIPASIAPRKGG